MPPHSKEHQGLLASDASNPQQRKAFVDPLPSEENCISEEARRARQIALGGVGQGPAYKYAAIVCFGPHLGILELHSRVGVNVQNCTQNLECNT